MNFCDDDHTKCVYEKMKTLSTETILTLRDTCKTVVNERYSESTKKPIRKVVSCPECNESGFCVSEKSTSLELCDTCKGNDSILITVQNVDEMKGCTLIDTLLKGKEKYPAGTFWIGYPETKVEDTNIGYKGITFNDKASAKFRDQYQNFRGYTYFRWVVIEDIDTNEYSFFSLDTNKKLVKTIRNYLGATNDEDLIISYKDKTYFAPAQNSATLFGSFILATHKELVGRLNYRIGIEHKRRSRQFTLGFSCVDTGKIIYVGSDECHNCKCYGGSNGQKVTCKLHKLDK